MERPVLPSSSSILSAGSCKIKATDFVRANGYNPEFAGWGDEDVEFYHRLSHLGSDLREWHRMPEAREAVLMNLEWPDLVRIPVIVISHSG